MIFNKDAKAMRKERGAKDDDSLRDMLSSDEFRSEQFHFVC